MFYKKDVLTNFAKFTGNTCARVSILIKLQASGSASTKMFLIWTKNICKFFRRFVCWKTRRKQVAIRKKSNYILQVFALFFSLRPSFTLAVTCSNSRVWKHFKSIIVSFCTRKIEVTTHYLKTLSALKTCSSGENITPEVDGLSWAKPLLHISVLGSLGQFSYEYCFFHAISPGKFKSHLFGMFSDITRRKLCVYHLSQM